MVNKILNFYVRPLVRDTVNTTVLSTVGKTVGFLVPFFIAAWFGVSSETDAFFFAYGLILFLAGIFAPVVESVIVPYIAEARSKNEDIGRFVGNILGIGSVGLVVLTVLLLLFVKPILSVITRFDEQTLRLIYRILVETSPLIILLVWTSVLAGTLNAYKKFAFPAISPAFRAIVNLIIIFTFKDRYGVHSIAFGYVAGELVRLTILLIVANRLDLFKLRLSFQFKSKLVEFLKTASYQIIGMAAVGLNPFVDKTMATWIGKGSVSILHYADRLYMIPVTFMTTGLMVTLLSHWSQRYAEKGIQRLRNDVKKAAKVVTFITLPIAIVLILFHKPIVKLAFGRGTFDQALLSEVGYVWICYLFGFVSYVIARVYVRGLLVIRKTKSILIVSVVKNLSNILLNWIFMSIWQVKGIALATSFVSLIEAFMFVWMFKKAVKAENRQF